MKVIGAGLGGTGGHATRTALEVLGFGPCYHMGELFRHPEHVPLWRAAADTGAGHWDEILHAYQSSVDFPGCVFYADLMRAYPEAKVVLTVRDPEQSYNRVGEMIARYSAADSPMSPDLQRLSQTLILDRTFGGAFEDRTRGIRVFPRWVENVRRQVPPERLLVFDTSQGWEPLCRFLDVDEPQQPFPNG